MTISAARPLTFPFDFLLRACCSQMRTQQFLERVLNSAWCLLFRREIISWTPDEDLESLHTCIYIYIQTGSLKTVGQNDIPSRKPVFCVLSGHVFFFKSARTGRVQFVSIFWFFELRAVEFRLQGSSLFLAEFVAFFVFDVFLAKADDLLLWMTKMFSEQR